MQASGIPFSSCRWLAARFASPCRRCASEARSRHPRGHWDAMENRRAFLDKVASSFGVESPNDWLSVSTRDIQKQGGSGLLNRYPSFLAALSDIYPEHTFSAKECRKSVPNGYWKEKSRRRDFMDQVAAAHGIEKAEDWRKVTTGMVQSMRGGGLLKVYGGSLRKALADVYPDMDVSGKQCRPHMPAGYWDDASNRRTFMDGVAEKLGVRCMRDWARVTYKDVASAGGSVLVAHRYGSLFAALSDIYPAFAQEACLGGGSLPSSYWECDEAIRSFLDHAATQLAVSSPEAWLRVSKDQLMAVKGGSSLLTSMPLHDALTRAYPSVRWPPAPTKRTVKKAAQRLMAERVSDIILAAPLASCASSQRLGNG